MADFQRTNIRLPAERYLGRRFHFITLCFHERRHYGANSKLAGWLIYQLRKHASTCEFFIYAFCVMPDHLHILAAGASETSNMLKLTMMFKQDTACDFSRKTHRALWQSKYYDHILRGSDSADRVAWYIWMNPVRKGLCSQPHDYPFLGSFTETGNRLLKSASIASWTPPWKHAVPNPIAPPQMPS